MDAAGFQEVHFPALLPASPYEASDRWTDYGDNMFRLQDRRGNDFLLAPTHEEMFTLLVKDLYSSYQDLPLVIYQIQTKYRDEARPRAGLLRGREFVMKDSYSFDVDDAGLGRVVPAPPRRLHRARSSASGCRTSSCRRCRGRWADRPARSSSPRSTSARTRSCAARPATTPPTSRRCGSPPRRRSRTTTCRRRCPTTRPTRRRSPRSSTSSTPATTCARDDGRPWAAADTLKNVVVMLRHPDGSTEPLAIGVPGDRDVDDEAARGGDAARPRSTPFGEADFARYPELAKGYIGPGALGVGLAERHPLPRRPACRRRARRGSPAPTRRATT